VAVDLLRRQARHYLGHTLAIERRQR
jgi:hypothetical protein